jgi:hypothetical protein
MEEFTTNKNDRIIVIDSPCGFGKTSYAIQAINESSDDEKIIYITPYLTEVSRIIEQCPDKHFVQPNTGEGKGSKAKHLLLLVQQERNIVSTHALFMNISEELINALRLSNYTLYLDEVFETIGSYNISDDENKENDEEKESKDNRRKYNSEESEEIINKNDMNILLSTNLMNIDENYLVRWSSEDNTLSKYENLKNLSERRSLYLIDGGLLIWSFPVEVFREGIFTNIYILTYRFDSQIQALYYKYYDITYTKYCVFKNEDKYEIKIYNNIKEKEWKSKIKEKIHIIEDPKLNKIGDVYYDAQNRPYKSALSLNWYKNNKNSETMKKLSNNISNYYRHHTSNKSVLKLWTCFKSYKSIIKGKNLSDDSWTAINVRATNEYRDKTLLCYPVNRFTNPFLNKFFAIKNIELNQDEYAVTEIIQWIWRSAIREMQDITIYIPSQRMRTLLKKFLNDENIYF